MSLAWAAEGGLKEESRIMRVEGFSEGERAVGRWGLVGFDGQRVWRMRNSEGEDWKVWMDVKRCVARVRYLDRKAMVSSGIVVEVSFMVCCRFLSISDFRLRTGSFRRIYK